MAIGCFMDGFNVGTRWLGLDVVEDDEQRSELELTYSQPTLSSSFVGDNYRILTRDDKTFH